MNASRDPDRLIRSFILEGDEQLHDRVYDAVRAEIDQRRQRAVIGPWMTPVMNKFGAIAVGAAAVVVALVIGPQLLGPATPGGVGGAPSATLAPNPTAEPSSAADDLMSSFLEARIAGEGAKNFVNNPGEDIPLLYATASGAPYERAEFERVRGIEWPYGLMAFKVRLFAGDVVVEQLFFSNPDGSLGLEYQPDGFATHIAPTTEDGKPVAEPHTYFDGEVTLDSAHPWVFYDYSITGGLTFGRLIPEGPGVRPTTDGGERNDWDRLVLMADPVGTDCQAGPGTADAAALAESIRSDPNLEATAPVAVSAGGAEALMMDVVIAAGASICDRVDSLGNALNLGILSLVLNNNAEIRVDNGLATGLATGDLIRLYLFDVPEGSSMRILAIAIVAPEARFERAVEAASPVVDSVEFRAP